MKLATKAAMLLSIVSAVTVTAGITMAKNPFNLMTHAEGETCQHQGNHYTVLAPTETTAGCKQYWVCCLCHEHYLSLPTAGTWEDKGPAQSISDSSDDRYLPSFADAKANEFKGFGYVGYSTDNGGGYVLGAWKNQKNENVIIPEGVVKLEEGTFKGNNNNSWIVIPSTLSDNALKDVNIYGTGASKVTMFFVSTTTLTKTDLGCKAIYQQQGIGWDYRPDGQPAPYSANGQLQDYDNTETI